MPSHFWEMPRKVFLFSFWFLVGFIGLIIKWSIKFISNLKWFNKRQIKIIKYSNLILYHRYCFYDIWIIISYDNVIVPT